MRDERANWQRESHNHRSLESKLCNTINENSRDINNVSLESLFRADIAQSPLVIGSPDGVDDLLDLYNATLLGLLNKHAPEKEKVVPDRPSSPWINEAVIKVKPQARRRAEETENRPCSSH